jgi:hypothetical protein
MKSIYIANTPLLKKLKLKLFGKLLKKEIVDYGTFAIEFCDYSYGGKAWGVIRKIVK